MKQNRAEWDTLLSIEHGKNKLINQVFLILLRRSRALLHRYAVVFLSHSRLLSALVQRASVYSQQAIRYGYDIKTRCTLERRREWKRSEICEKGREREGNCVKWNVVFTLVLLPTARSLDICVQVVVVVTPNRERERTDECIRLLCSVIWKGEKKEARDREWDGKDHWPFPRYPISEHFFFATYIEMITNTTNERFQHFSFLSVCIRSLLPQ